VGMPVHSSTTAATDGKGEEIERRLRSLRGSSPLRRFSKGSFLRLFFQARGEQKRERVLLRAFLRRSLPASNEEGGDQTRAFSSFPEKESIKL